MSLTLGNVHAEVRDRVRRDTLASELASGLEGTFTVTAYRKVTKYGGAYTTLFCKPTTTVSRALLIDREVLGLIANYPDIHARTIAVAQELIASHSPQLHPGLVIVVHADRQGDSKLRSWGREQGITVLPIHRPKGGAIPPAGLVRQRLARELFSSDPFQVTGPVSEDIDFFGRRNEAIDLLRQLEKGRIRALFGMRKVGKTSLINRLIALARAAGSPRVAMVDCSVRAFNSLDAANALKALGKVRKMAATQGYAHITDALKKTDKELVPVFSDLWEQPDLARWPLVVVFDEVDFITPDSPVAAQWGTQFNDFWREFRVLIQEAQRHAMVVSVLVSGVSSRCFRVERIGSVENSALHLVPEEYLSSFERGASDSMIRELGKRCGLLFTDDARAAIADACGDFPFWTRMACSHIHRAVDLDNRPVELGAGVALPLLEHFVAGEGADIARVALGHLQRVYPELFETLRQCLKSGRVGVGDGRLLVRYGLAVERGGEVGVKSRMVEAGAAAYKEGGDLTVEGGAIEGRALTLSESEWAEELAVISRRRNILERRLRDLIHFTLKVRLPSGESWIERVLRALPEERRKELGGLAAGNIMERLFWRELTQVISRDWEIFASTFVDKKKFQLTMELLNERPDTHAKTVDLADVALQRRELGWLEERVGS